MQIITISRNQWIFQGNTGTVPQLEARCWTDGESYSPAVL